MSGLRIRWGNVLILLLIIAAAIAAFYYKYPKVFPTLFDKNQSNTQKLSPENALVLGLDSWIGGTPALIALNREYHKDYSLDLKIKYIPNDLDRITALKNKEIHITEISLPSYTRLLNQFPNTGYIVGITDFSRGADGIVAKSDIKTLNDMDAKRVSYVGDGTGKFLLNKFLRLTGLRFQDIKPIERKEMSEVVDDFKTGKADLMVSWNPDMNLVVKDMNSQQPGSAKLLITTREAPDLVPTVLVASKELKEKYPDSLNSFLKTWYISAKYIIERPDKAYEKLAQLMAENKEVYGNITLEDVKESFSTIKLMSINDNYTYFGLTGKDKIITSIMTDTAQTWKKYGDISSDTLPGDILADSFMAKLYKEKDADLSVGVADPEGTGTASPSAEQKTEFKKQDAASIDKTTEQVAKVDIPPVYYDSGKATVRPESFTVLHEILNVLKQFPQYYLVIEAHTDTVGNEDFNLELSYSRAEEVKKYLVSIGADANRLVARGWGESKPIVALEKTEEDMARNRRTEFILSREIK